MQCPDLPFASAVAAVGAAAWQTISARSCDAQLGREGPALAWAIVIATSDSIVRNVAMIFIAGGLVRRRGRKRGPYGVKPAHRARPACPAGRLRAEA